MTAGAVDAVESVQTTTLGKYNIKDLRKIHRKVGCEILYDEATGDYSINLRHYVIDLLCNKYLSLGTDRMVTPLSEASLTKEICRLLQINRSLR